MKLLIIILITSTFTKSAPILSGPGFNHQVHGIIVEEDIPENKIYPDPTYVAPLIIEGQDNVHITSNDPDKPGHIGHVPAECLRAQLMPLDYFIEHYTYPENVEFKYVPNAEPFFGMKQ